MNGLMQLAWVQNNYDLMLDIAEKLITVGGLEFRIRNAAGAYAIAGRIDDGLDILNKALKSDHHNPDYHYYVWRAKVDLLAFTGRFHDALSESALMMARSDTPQERRLACDALLNSYLYMGKFRDAIHVIDQVIKIHEGENLDTWILKNLARKAVYIQWGWAVHDSAANIIEKTLESGKAREYYQYRIFLFSYYANRGEVAKAEQEIERLEFHENMIPVLRGEYENAVQKASAYREKVMSWDMYPIWRYEIAKHFLKKNQHDKALAQLDTMNTMYCSQYGYRAVFYPRSFYLRGQIHEAAGEISLAMENYQKLLDIWKDADQDLVVLVDTKRRLKKLQSSRL
jgi:tetratricopeptide (TPR) repeat protein